MRNIILSLSLFVIATVFAQVPPENCPPGLIIDHCNTAVSGLECYDPPFIPSKFGDMHKFDERAVINAMAWVPGTSTLYIGGQGAGNSVEGRQLHNSTDGGYTFIVDERPPGAINSLGWGPEGVMVGSWYQWQQDSGNPEASFAQFTVPGSGSWSAAPVIGWPDHLKSISINERGVSYYNGTFFLCGITTYEIVPPTPDDPWSQSFLGRTSDNGRTWTWTIFDVPENKGVYEVRMINGSHGIAIGGTHWYSGQTDYLGYILITDDGGDTWEKVHEDEGTYTFTDIDCVGSSCWVIGHGLGSQGSQHISFVWRSNNFGRTWIPQLTVTGSATSYSHVWNIHMVDQELGYVQGDYWGGLLVIYVTEDGGANWKIAFEPNCQDRHYVHDAYSINGVLHMLVQEVDIMQTGIIRMEFPQRKAPMPIIAQH